MSLVADRGLRYRGSLNRESPRSHCSPETKIVKSYLCRSRKKRMRYRLAKCGNQHKSTEAKSRDF